MKTRNQSNTEGQAPEAVPKWIQAWQGRVTRPGPAIALENQQLVLLLFLAAGRHILVVLRLLRIASGGRISLRPCGLGRGGVVHLVGDSRAGGRALGRIGSGRSLLLGSALLGDIGRQFRNGIRISSRARIGRGVRS